MEDVIVYYYPTDHRQKLVAVEIGLGQFVKVTVVSYCLASIYYCYFYLLVNGGL